MKKSITSPEIRFNPGGFNSKVRLLTHFFVFILLIIYNNGYAQNLQAKNDTLANCSGSSIVIQKSTLTANDLNPGNVPIYMDVAQPAHGTVVYNGTSITYTPQSGYSGPDQFNYTIKNNDGTITFSGNGHVYEWVSSANISWSDARNAASGRTYNGMQGYLVTITSAAEMNFVSSKLQGNGWMGASDIANEGVWRWVTGPEGLENGGQGRNFSTQSWNGWCSAGTGVALGGNFVNWAGGEPNNCGGNYPESSPTSSTRAGEHYAHFWGAAGWNDWPNVVGGNNILGYIVEYGGLEPNTNATSTATVFINQFDSDGDGITNACDMDDDNDGIPDVAECNKSNFFWSNPPAISGKIATGTINGIGYTYTSSANVGSTGNVFNHGIFPSSYGVPNNNPTISNDNITNNTLTFASPMTNPVLVFASIGSGNNYVPISFGAPIQILWSDHVTQNSSTQITGNEGYAIIRMMGTFSSITFNYLAAEWYCNFAFGADFQTCPDTDGDGTPDFADSDSDNDGCVDALEGSSAFLLNQILNSKLTGPVASNGIPTLAGAGQGVGTSQIYAANCSCQPGNDNTPPNVITQNITVNLDASGNATITAAQVNNGSSDECGIKSMSVSPSTFSCANIGPNTVTLTVTDSSSSVSATAIVTVRDITAPVFACPANINVNATAGRCDATLTLTPPTVTDNCTFLNNALSFAGDNDYVNTTRNVSGDFTIEYWMKTAQTGPSGGMWYNGVGVVDAEVGGVTNDFGTSLNGNKICFGVGNPDRSIFSSTTVNTNTWVHVAATRNQSTGEMKLYINGVLEASTFGSTNSLINSQIIRLGAMQSGANGLYNGMLDEIRIWNVVRSATDIQTSMNRSFTSSLPAGLVSNYNCNQGVAGGSNTTITSLVDGTGSNNGTLYGFAMNGAISNFVSGSPSISAVTLSNSFNSTSNGSGVYPVGTTNITWTATDASGNTSTCIQTVTVQDITPPTIACTANISVSTSANSCDANITVTPPTVTDNCPMPSASVPAPFNANDPSLSLWIDATKFSTTNGGSLSGIIDDASTFNRSLVTNATYDATGFNGRPAVRYNNNQTASSAFNTNGNTYIFTTLQIVAPTNNWASVFYHWNRDNGLTIEHNAFSPNGAPAGTAQYHFQTGNDNTNVEQNIMYGTSYIMVATITGGSVRSFTLYKDNGGVLQNMGTSTNSAFVLPNQLGQLFLGKSDIGEYTNMRMGEFLYFQGSLPTSELSIVNYLHTKWFGSASVLLSNNVTNTSNASGVYPLGTTNITWTAKDAYGNTSTCNQSVTVTDNVAPVVLIQPVTINLNASGTASITTASVNNGSTDNCGIASMTVSPTTFNCTSVNRNNSVANNYAADLNNGTDHILIGEVTPAGVSYTKEAWVNMTATSCGNIVSSNSSPFWITGGHLSAGNSGVFSVVTDPGTFPLNTWTHVAVTYNATSNTMMLYRNGTLVATNTSAPANLGGTNAIGKHFGGGCYFDGKVDEVRIWNRALTVGEIMTNKDNTLVGNESGLTAYYPLENGPSGTSALDVTGHGFNGTFVNTTPALLWTTATSPVTSNLVTLTVTDIHGNVSSATAQVTVNDITPPQVITQNISVNLNASGNATITAAQVNNGSSDVCGIATLTLDKNAFNCSDLGANTVTLTVTDVNGNSTSATAIVTVNDMISPMLSGVPAPHLNAICDAIPSPATVTATDNCSTSPVSYFQVPTVSVNTAHQWPADGNFQDLNGTANGTPVGTVNFGTGLLGSNAFDFAGSSYINAGTSGSVSGTGDFAVGAWVRTASTGGMTIIQQRDIDIAGQYILKIGTNHNGGASAPGKVYFLVAGAEGLGETYSSASVNDGKWHHILGERTGSTIRIYVDGQLSATASTGGIVTMNVNGAIKTTIGADIRNIAFNVAPNYFVGMIDAVKVYHTSACASAFERDRYWITMDGSMNTTAANQNLHIVDTTGPIINCPANIVVTTRGLCGANVNFEATATDNCSMPTLEYSKASGSFFPVGTTLVKVKATDVCGNVSFCNFNVTVMDMEAPTVITQNITIQLNASGGATITPAMIENGSTDNCGITSYNLNQLTFNCSKVGVNTVYLTVTDIHGNSATQAATVTVKDLIAPTVVTQNATIQLNANGAASITVAMINNGSSDNCGIASMDLNNELFTCANVGTNSVMLTVTDVNGNTAAQLATVIVQDLIAPTVVAQDVIIQLDANGSASITTAMINNGSFDNCSIASMSLSQTNFSCSNVGPNTVTLTVIDVNGNISTTDVTVTVQDMIAPTVLTQNIDLYLDAMGNALTTAAAVNNGSFDNCLISSLSLSKTYFNCSNVGANNVTLTVTDVNGNVSTADATVTVKDSIAPIVVTNNLTIGLNANGQASITAMQINDGSSDNCTIATYSLNKTTFTCANMGANEVILTVTDVNGNSASAPATVTVLDQITPTVLTQNIHLYLNTTGVASTTAAAVDNGSFDNCTIASLSLSKTDFNCSNVGANNVILTVTDVNGNVSTGTATLTVHDNLAPIVHTQNITVTLVNGAASITAAQINNGSTDNCSIASMSVSPSSFTCGTLGNNTVTLTVTDVNGNSASATATVFVTGLIPTCSITSSPNNSGTVIGSTITGAAINQLYLGYGAQSMQLVCTAVGAAPFTYSWTGSGLSSSTIANPVFTPTAGGNYTFICTITNAYGCQTTCSIVICVIDARAPGSSINNPKVLLCHVPPGNPNNPQSLSISVNAVPAHLGNHTGDRLGSCASACGFSKTEQATGDLYSETTTMGDVDLVVYPNPSMAVFNFKLESGSTEDVSIVIYDISGKVIVERYHILSTEKIVIDEITTPGVYIAEVKQGEFHKTVKLTKVN